MSTPSANMFLLLASAVFRGLSSVNAFLAGVARISVAIMLVVNLSIVFAGVIFRYVFGQPLGWVYEVAIFLMMWSAFVGSAALSRDKAHVSLDFIILKFPVRVREGIRAVLEIAVIVLLVVIIQSSLTMIQGLMASKSAYLRLPMVWVYSSVPVGMGMVLLQQIEHLISQCVTVAAGRYPDSDASI